MDSEVSFEDDPDEDIDTTTIKEEEWIDYIKRSTVNALDKMEHAKIQCWNRTCKKYEMETDIENCNFTECRMTEKS